MTTAPRTPRSGPRPGAAGPVVLAAALVTALLGTALVVVAGLVEGRPALVGAAAGTAVVVVFFGLGTLALDAVARVAPALSMLVALLTYTLQVVLVGLVFVALRRSGTLDGDVDAQWLGGAVIVGTFAWLTTQVVATTRRRVPLYDLPDQPGPGPAEGQEAGAR